MQHSYNDITAYIFDLLHQTNSPALLQTQLDILSVGECQRLDAIIAPQVRLHYGPGRIMIRDILFGILKISPLEVEIKIGISGKP